MKSFLVITLLVGCLFSGTLLATELTKKEESEQFHFDQRGVKIIDKKPMLDDKGNFLEDKLKIIEPPKTVPIEKKEKPNFQKMALLYGMKYFSQTQTSSTFDNVKIGTLFFNNLKFNYEYITKDWSAWFNLDSFKFAYNDSKTDVIKSLYSYNLGAVKNSYVAGLASEQSLLFRDNVGTIDVASQSTKYLFFGKKKTIKVVGKEATFLNLKGWVQVPFMSSSDTSNVTVSRPVGYGARVDLEYNQGIYKDKDFSISFDWTNNLGFNQVSQKVKWESQSGTITSTRIDFSSTVGLMVKF